MLVLVSRPKRSLGAVMAILFVGGLASLAPVSAAEAQTPEQRQRAREMYAQGQREFDAGNFEAAQAAFEQAYAAVANPVVLLGVASAQERRGMTGEACGTLRRYLRERADAPDRATIEGRIEGLHCPDEAPPQQATIRIACQPAGAAIAIDGTDTGRVAPADITVAPGEHTVTLTLGGYLAVSQQVSLVAGATSEITVTLTQQPAQASETEGEGTAMGEDDVFGAGGEGEGEGAAEGEGEGAAEGEGEGEGATAPPASTGPSAAVWVTTAIAGVALVTGSVFGFLALSQQSDFDAAPTHSAADQGEAFALVADLSFGIAVAAGVTAIVLYATEPHGDSSSATAHRDDDDGPQVSFAPVVGTQGGGAALSVSF